MILACASVPRPIVPFSIDASDVLPARTGRQAGPRTAPAAAHPLQKFVVPRGEVAPAWDEPGNELGTKPRGRLKDQPRLTQPGRRAAADSTRRRADRPAARSPAGQHLFGSASPGPPDAPAPTSGPSRALSPAGDPEPPVRPRTQPARRPPLRPGGRAAQEPPGTRSSSPGPWKAQDQDALPQGPRVPRASPRAMPPATHGSPDTAHARASRDRHARSAAVRPTLPQRSQPHAPPAIGTSDRQKMTSKTPPPIASLSTSRSSSRPPARDVWAGHASP